MKGRIHQQALMDTAFSVFGRRRESRKLSEEFSERQRIKSEWSDERFTLIILL
jgi:hypothetical protein